MKKIEYYTRQILPVLKRYLVKRASIFGSLAKDKLTESSDIDLLIEPDSNLSLFAMMQMEQDIARVTKRRIDIVEFSALKDYIKLEVLKTAIPIL